MIRGSILVVVESGPEDVSGDLTGETKVIGFSGDKCDVRWEMGPWF